MISKSCKITEKYCKEPKNLFIYYSSVLTIAIVGIYGFVIPFVIFSASYIFNINSTESALVVLIGEVTALSLGFIALGHFTGLKCESAWREKTGERTRKEVRN